MIGKIINSGTVRKNKVLINVKTSLCKFNSNNIYINNKINSSEQIIFR